MDDELLMQHIQDEARAIVTLARMLAGETVDGLALSDEEDGGRALARNFATSIRKRAGKIESALYQNSNQP